MLSIVIPTLNCRDDLKRTLEALDLRPADWEIIVSDGGSEDGTRELAEIAGVRIITGARGRGPQLDAGARAARSTWLLFWHADTQPQPGWAGILRSFMDDPANRFHAGYARLVLNDPSPQARRVEGLANWRADNLGLPYGDQGLLISAEYYEHLGGYKTLPLMEDVDLVRRIGAKRLVPLATAAVTSAIKYRRDGWWARPAKNVTCLCLYYLGVPVSVIARLYR